MNINDYKKLFNMKLNDIESLEVFVELFQEEEHENVIKDVSRFIKSFENTQSDKGNKINYVIFDYIDDGFSDPEFLILFYVREEDNLVIKTYKASFNGDGSNEEIKFYLDREKMLEAFFE
ncbi:hypothetical protein [Evansella cellulosilytica]|uniref:Uncharacterized protein n=1 Tax=Evansella cellulosilytica (strain ATCC 21833 / DSM 2522 / FERM P-1141 / JCM 9156 / N-4) TaxID=649639 RepID=E6TZU0_EVAC2|nr:hypothetical protein [Evansella cellulosilytica]ADU32506.1 hypothetical protein Bcell_4279 [Evansella cellulosilytica DSM 2522]